MIRLEVAVAAPLRQTFTYLWDEDKGGDVPVARRVLVPLGNRRLTGYVLGVLPDEDVGYRLRNVSEVLDSSPIFPVVLIPFFRWIARYYHHPIGEVIKTALPGGLSPKGGKELLLTTQGRTELEQVSTVEGKAASWLADFLVQGRLDPQQFKKALAKAASRRQVDAWMEQGLVEIREIVVGGGVRQKQEVCYSCASDLILPPAESVEADRSQIESFGRGLSSGCGSVPLAPLPFTRIKTLYHLHRLVATASMAVVPGRELNAAYSGAAAALPELLEKGLVLKQQRRIFRNPYGEQLPWFPQPEVLTQEQERVLSQLLPALQQPQFVPFLLHGVTGCGKTEVYLRAAAAALDAGRDVLVLVPEIALATQLEAHFVSRFGDRVLLLHSGLSSGERYDQWSLAGAAEGGPRIVIGARSAVFAPLADPGLIVVDEEHDGGFKQDDGLRYNGRDLAVLRAQMNRAVVLLGSATPAVTSFYHARQGKYRLLTMDRRVRDRSMPLVTLVDLRDKTQRLRGRAIGMELEQALRETLAQGKQSLLLLNRRGYASVMLCQDCGKPVECSHCHISLTLHKGKNQLVCHYCGFSTLSSRVCATCRSERLVPVGFGTERIEQEVKELLPTARITRLDSDTAADRRKFLHILKDMHNKEIDILIGTQMIAKGHDFPDVTLVGVVWADGGLSMPDFRAAERTYQLLSQVGGRAGRGESPGRVIVQTLRPDHYAIALARRHAYGEMFEEEMRIRQHPAFPPLLRMINIHIQGSSEQMARRSAGDVAALCLTSAKSLAGATGRPPVEILGPAPSPIDRLRDRFRWQVLLKGVNMGDLHSVCEEVVSREAELSPGDIRIMVDVDPENMM